MTRRLFLFSMPVIIVFLVIGTSSAKAQYVESNKILTSGKSVILKTQNSASLTVTYRPGSNISETQTLPATKAGVRWTPEKAGIFALKTPDGPSQTVSVSFGHFPFAGFIVFIIAGSILFGGAVYAAVNLFSDSSAKVVQG